MKVGARHTAGGYELFEVDAPRGAVTPPHREPWGKAFYLLHGRLLVQVGDEGFDLAPGASIAIPAGALNTFTVLTPSARFLVVSLTGGMGAFFADPERSVAAGAPVGGGRPARGVGMTIVAQLFALAGAAVHVLAFVWEVCVFGRPGVHRDIFRIPTSDVPAARMWAFNVGFYNLFLAAGAVIGVVLWWSGDDVVGRALVLYTCSFMAAAGVALFVSDRLALSRPRGAGIVGSIAQTVPPAVAILGMVW